MAYTTGVAVDMPAFRAAIISACENIGWTWNSVSERIESITLQAKIYLTIVNNPGAVLRLKAENSAASQSPSVQVGQTMGIPTLWPCEYHIFTFETEVFAILKVGVDVFGWCAFGKSNIDLSGSGVWVSATSGINPLGRISIEPTGGMANTSSIFIPAPFWGGLFDTEASRNTFIDSGLDDRNWHITDNKGLGGWVIGVKCLQPLIGIQPSAWNSESALLPIRCFLTRPEAKVSLALELSHARYIRVDNFEDGQLLELGSDKWKIFPFYRKNSAQRNGGFGVNHSGTFGWAIRYDGI